MATTYESGRQRRLSEGDGGTRAETWLAGENRLLEMIAALQESEERFRCLADSIPEVIWITQLEPERVLYASPSFERIWGRPLAELYRNPRLWTETIHPDDRGRVENTFGRWIAGDDVDYHDVEFRIVQPNGAVRWIHERGVVSLNAHGKPYRVSGISTDITEAKLAADALRRSEAYLTEAQRLSRTGSFGWCPSSGEIHWSDETFRIFEYDRASQPSIALVLARTHPDDRGDVEQTIERALRDGEDFDIEHRLQMPDGSIKHVHVVAHAIKNEWADLELVGAVSDVTTARVAEERIRQNEREFRQIVEAIPALILVLSPDGSPFYANQVLLEYTGLTLADVQAKDLRERIFHPEDLERVRDERRDALSRGAPFVLEQRVRRSDGHYRWFLIRFNPVRNEAGQVIRWYATGTDIHDRKRAEERVQHENIALREEIDNTSMFEEIVGVSALLQAVLSRVAKVAPTDSTVLISGETGTGKELIARAIHKRSTRSARAFVSVNCAGIPQSLIASELFGHEKGAFTGALQRRLGRFELAEGGTLFLDEVGELPTETQIALLRVLQEREFERVGGNKVIRSDVRLIAATNRDLQAAVAAGGFRSDLFYRLNVFPIRTPPLREREDDIPMLVEYFIARYAGKAGKKISGIEKKTLDRLRSYPWPGNIRELQNVIERSVILCETETFSIDTNWLSSQSPPPQPASPALHERLASDQKALIEAALAEAKGRVSGPSGAAAKLGIPPSTLDSKIKALKIDKQRFKGV
jgi:PAS domain S-box-containing protein